MAILQNGFKHILQFWVWHLSTISSIYNISRLDSGEAKALAVKLCNCFQVLRASVNTQVPKAYYHAANVILLNDREGLVGPAIKGGTARSSGKLAPGGLDLGILHSLNMRC